MKGNAGALRIITATKNGKTVLEDCYFKAPYKIASPFVQDDGSITLMVMNASAGILEGDTYEIDMQIGRGSSVTVTEQSYTKIFKMDSGTAVRTMAATIEEGACLQYLPLPVIPFRNSSCSSFTEINIEKGGSLVYRDILSCGRLGMGEKFAFSHYSSLLEIRFDGRKIFHENICMEPNKQALGSLGYYEGFTHQAAMFFFGRFCPNEDQLETLLKAFSNIEFGSTRILSDGVVLRILGKGADQLEKICSEVQKLVCKSSAMFQHC
jgi:urease accessory protein